MLIIAIVIGYLPALAEFQVWKAIMVGTYVLLLSLFLGWAMGDGHGHLKDVGALGTAQRGVAPAMTIRFSSLNQSPSTLQNVPRSNLGRSARIKVAEVACRAPAIGVASRL